MRHEMYREFQRQETFDQNATQAPQYQPDEAEAVSLLQYLSKEQLEEHLQDPSKLDTIILDLQQLKRIQRDRENILVKNKSLAEYNVGMQPKFEDLKSSVATGYENLNRLKISLAEDVAKLESHSGRQSQETMLAIFQTETAMVDEKSEEIADSFCEGKTDIDSFINDYLPQRTEAYLKRAKLEKLSELVRHGGMTSSAQYTSSTQHQPPTKPSPGSYQYSTAGYGAGGTPYPAYSAMPTPYQH